MCYFSEGSPAMVELERMVDTVGVRNVLWALAYIASEKAEHVSVNWQDAALGKRWARVHGFLDGMARGLKDDPLEPSTSSLLVSTSYRGTRS